VIWASLLEAHARAFLGVPVVAIEQASLRSTFVFTGVRVEDVVGVFFPVSFAKLGSALA